MMRRCRVLVRLGLSFALAFALVALLASPSIFAHLFLESASADVTQVDVELGSTLDSAKSGAAKSSKSGNSKKSGSSKSNSKSGNSKKSDSLDAQEEKAVKRASKSLTKADDEVSEITETAESLDELSARLAELNESITTLESELDAYLEDHTYTTTRLTVAAKDTSDVTAALDELSETSFLDVLFGRVTLEGLAREVSALNAELEEQEVVTETVDILPAEARVEAATMEDEIAEAEDELAEVVDEGNEIAATIESADSISRTHDADAAETLESTLDVDKDDAQTVLEEADEVTSEHDDTRLDARDVLSGWYGTVDEVGGLESDLTFGTGVDFSLGKDEFVEKWGAAIDEFYGAYAAAYGLDVPLEGYGELMAECAYDCEIDPRLCAAVSIAESSGGVYCIADHNAWGWGAADSDPAGLAWSWESWEDAITEWHECMASSTTGLADAGSVSALGEIYASSPTWAATVTTQMETISEFV